MLGHDGMVANMGVALDLGDTQLRGSLVAASSDLDRCHGLVRLHNDQMLSKSALGTYLTGCRCEHSMLRYEKLSS